MYEVSLLDEASTAVAHLPSEALKSVGEVLDLLAIQPYAGRLYGQPGTDLRIITVSGQLLVVWLVLEDQLRVEVLRILWLDTSIRAPVAQRSPRSRTHLT